MAKISFRAKVQQMYNMDDTLAYEYVQVPKLDRKHCDMSAFRNHPKYGGLANSTLFPNILAGIRKGICNSSGWIKLDAMPEGVSVDTSGFLALVEFDV